MGFLLIFIIAVSVSMDAFSLSLAYGTLGIEKRQKYILTFIVGVYHFIMPIIGYFIGTFFIDLFNLDPNIIVTFILSFIGIDMIISSFKKEEIHYLKKYEYFLFGLAVSIDSFSIGFTLNSGNLLFSSLMFCFCSMIFTFIGLLFGNKIKKSLGSLSTLIGGIILIIIGVCYL